jgi:hypothetical protein
MQRTALPDLRHSLPALRRVTALAFPACFGESGELDDAVDVSCWLATHVGNQTPSSRLYVDSSGLIISRRADVDAPAGAQELA